MGRLNPLISHSIGQWYDRIHAINGMIYAPLYDDK